MFADYFVSLWPQSRIEARSRAKFTSTMPSGSGFERGPNQINYSIMSERDKQIERERKGVVELLLKKNGLTRRQLVEELVGFWAASWAHTLTEEERKQFPHLVF